MGKCLVGFLIYGSPEIRDLFLFRVQLVHRGSYCRIKRGGRRKVGELITNA